MSKKSEPYGLGLTVSEIIQEKTKVILRKKNITFSDMRDLQGMVGGISQLIYDDVTTQNKLDLIWNKKISLLSQDVVSNIFGEIFYHACKEAIQTVVSVTIHEELATAKIIFNNNEVDKNEVSKRSVGGQSSKRRTPDETNDSEE